MSIYKFITPGLFKGVTAEEAALELERIREKHGELTPALIVQESEDEDAVLHSIFQWDNARAAQLYRERQAGNLIRNIVVSVTNETVSYNVRAFVNVQPAPEKPREYVPLQEAIANEDAYKDLLEQARCDMQSFVDKYRQITELNAVKAEMLKAMSL